MNQNTVIGHIMDQSDSFFKYGHLIGCLDYFPIILHVLINLI